MGEEKNLENIVLKGSAHENEECGYTVLLLPEGNVLYSSIDNPVAFTVYSKEEDSFLKKMLEDNTNLLAEDYIFLSHKNGLKEFFLALLIKPYKKYEELMDDVVLEKIDSTYSYNTIKIPSDPLLTIKSESKLVYATIIATPEKLTVEEWKLLSEISLVYTGEYPGMVYTPNLWDDYKESTDKLKSYQLDEKIVEDFGLKKEN